MISEIYTKAKLVEVLKQTLDNHIECIEDFVASDNKFEDRYELDVLKVLRKNIDSISTDPIPDSLLCVKCQWVLHSKACGK